MEPGAMQRMFVEGRRRLLAGFGAALAATVLAGCGGGSSMGTAPFTPGPVPCASAASASADGYAIGMCASTKTAVFLETTSSVAITGTVDGHILSLVFPSALGAYDGSTGFTAASRVPGAFLRDVLGALQGSAYEEPLRQDLVAPYTALTDFHAACCYHDNPPWAPPQLAYVEYGSWEKVPTASEGFIGVWYGARSAMVVDHSPIGPVNRVYRGYVAGTVAPDEVGGGYLDRVRSFSAPIEIIVDGTGRIVSGRIQAMVTSAYDPVTGQLVLQDLPVDPVDLVEGAAGSPPGMLTGTLASAGGAYADVDPASSRFEARYFGVSGNIGAELAGRLRFRAGNGLIAVAAFGAQFVP